MTSVSRPPAKANSLPPQPGAVSRITRWDLDKTYLRTEFDTLRDLVKTAFESPEAKRANPGASTLLREMASSGIRVHILSGSPEQMRRSLERKLKLDGIEWASFTLKPNLRNVLRLRFRALRDQLGYKLPALLGLRIQEHDELAREWLFGDDSEADAFVYSLYSDILEGTVDETLLRAIARRGKMYDDVLDTTLFRARSVPREKGRVARILIHLDQQTPPDVFAAYGRRVVPFYNYLQAAFLCQEDGTLAPRSVLRVGAELVEKHRFDGDQLARSYLDLARRGHLRGTGISELQVAFEPWFQEEGTGRKGQELRRLVDRLPDSAAVAKANHNDERTLPDYLALVTRHNRRRE